MKKFCLPLGLFVALLLANIISSNLSANSKVNGSGNQVAENKNTDHTFWAVLFYTEHSPYLFQLVLVLICER